MEVTIAPVAGRRELGLFIELAYRLNAGDPNWVPPLRSDMVELLTPGRNPFHEHARMQLFLARRGRQVVGRISAHIDEQALAQPVEQGLGPGTGNWGLLEAEDEGIARSLIATAEEWLRIQGMTRVLAPISLSIWEEPGLLVRGHDHPPTMMMGHHPAEHQGWIEGAGYEAAKSLLTYDLPIDKGLPPLIDRIVASGERSSRITLRTVDPKNFARDAEIAIDILNDAWSGNWGFVPFTDAEKAYGAKKLKPITLERTNMIAEVDGEPVAFMLAWPDLNEQLIGMKGRLFPFNWAKLLWWLRKPQVRTFRVPLMGVRKRLQNSRMASQIAFMMIEYIRRVAVGEHGASRGEIGWVLDDNGGMIAIADAIGGKVNREYRVYQKTL
ncbi:hypothetical protein PK98_10225 [Croceibacterium mercuriale]|uniref:N-acetyltransferase domain-containing protein n=1 Tax=Croceibacterium mercuriale TaxID=1572751 RepID=A0A0B2BS51_9SPHN|nr:hypothetical protein [Croceibacterium mercuriale]KHL24418.1 hypothetical protein PK98_10225 [Croceibacterium mercuriale]